MQEFAQTEVVPAELPAPAGGEAVPDLVLRAGPLVFVVETKATARAGPIALAIRQVRKYAEHAGGAAVPLIVVPYMGPMGQKMCAESGVSWLDLCGNADIAAPGLRIHVEGRPNRFKSPGRPADPFAPKSSRIARQLLIEPGRAYTQTELAAACDLDKGLVSRVVRKLEEDGLLVREARRAVRPRSPDVLLQAWSERYDFLSHTIRRGHVAARSGQSLLDRLAGVLGSANVRFAATGLAGAWLWAPFATFRTVSFYLEDDPEEELLENFGFREETKAPNVWLAIPRDGGVFHGMADPGGIPCVHPVQVYLDLQAHPERAREAAERLRETHLKW